MNRWMALDTVHRDYGSITVVVGIMNEATRGKGRGDEESIEGKRDLDARD